MRYVLTLHGGRVPAGWLIEKAGMKDASVGHAEASPQHPHYIANNGGATSKNIHTLANKIRVTVQEKFEIELNDEAVIL